MIAKEHSEMFYSWGNCGAKASLLAKSAITEDRERNGGEMLRRIRLSWATAKALSVLQNAYDLPLKNPLDPLDATDLQLTTAASFDTGGNAFDAAAGFMTLRLKCAMEVALKLGQPLSADDRAQVPKMAVGFARTRSFMKFYRLHMDALAQINKLKAEIDARDGFERGSI